MIDIGDHQVEDQFVGHATVEVGRDFMVGEAGVRPFVELQAGLETLARAGVDVTFGRIGENGLMLRDVPTGQRFIGIDTPSPTAFSAVLGGDVAYVANSIYLPSSEGYAVEDVRYRLRGGVEADFGIVGSTFFGLTYISEEYVGQPEGQVVGSLNVRLDF